MGLDTTNQHGAEKLEGTDLVDYARIKNFLAGFQRSIFLTLALGVGAAACAPATMSTPQNTTADKEAQIVHLNPVPSTHYMVAQSDVTFRTIDPMVENNTEKKDVHSDKLSDRGKNGEVVDPWAKAKNDRRSQKTDEIRTVKTNAYDHETIDPWALKKK